MSSSTWQDHFKEQLVGLEPPREGSFLELALAEGRIKEKDYLEWASQTQLLPVLSMNYFTEASPSEDLLQKVNLPWRSTFFPVHHWDGHLIVAGLENPGNLPPHCSFVLAPREGLALWWDKISEHAAPLEGPDGIELSAPTPDSGLEISLEATSTSSLSFSGASLASPTQATPSAEAPSIEFHDHSDSNIEIESVQPTALPGEIAATETVMTETAASDSSFDDISESSFNQTRTAISVQPSEVPNPPEKPINLRFNQTLEKHLLTDSFLNFPGFKADLQKFLTQISGAYGKTMFLALDEKRQGFIPLAWSESFGSPTSATKIPFGQPGFFQIVMATEKPYHGYIVPSEANEQFLQAWNQGKTPETLTIVPLMRPEGMLGAIVAIGPKSSYSMTILRHVEKTGADLLKAWKIVPAQKAA